MRRGLADPGGFAMIFKQDPAAALDKTRAKLSSVELLPACGRSVPRYAHAECRRRHHDRRGDRGRDRQTLAAQLQQDIEATRAHQGVSRARGQWDAAGEGHLLLPELISIYSDPEVPLPICFPNVNFGQRHKYKALIMRG